jgi:hypothetical protein
VRPPPRIVDKRRVGSCLLRSSCLATASSSFLSPIQVSSKAPTSPSIKSLRLPVQHCVHQDIQRLLFFPARKHVYCLYKPLESSKMLSFFLISLLVLLSPANAAPQSGVVGIIGGLLGDVPVVAPLLGATGAILDEIPVLYASPPDFLLTQNPSPQCANINGG